MADLDIEVVFALAGKQSLLPVVVPEGSTVAEVLDVSGIALLYPDFGFDQLPVGVWGRIVARDHEVAPGDRVEVYRPLQMDPREARRQLARAGRTMGNAESV